MWILAIIIFVLVPIRSESFPGPQASPEIRKAIDLIVRQKPAEALKILSRHRASVEDLADYHYANAKAHESAGNRTDALAHYRLAYIYATDGSARETILMARSEAYLKMGFYPESSISFRQFLQNFPKSPSTGKAFLGLAESLYYQGLFSEALNYYEKSGDSVAAMYGKANSCQALGKNEKAYEIFTAAKMKEKAFLESSPESLYRLAEACRLTGRFSDAKIHYGSLKAPAFTARAQIGLGLIDLEQGHYDSACNFFSKAASTSERQIRSEALLNLAEAHSRAGRKSEARAAYEEIRNSHPYSAEYDKALLMLARIHQGEGNRKKAVALMKELAGRDNHSQEAIDQFEQIVLEAVEGDAGNLQELWFHFGRLLLDPSRSDSLIRIAGGLRSSGRPFIDLVSWMTKNGSVKARAAAGIMLSEYYLRMGDAKKALAGIRGMKDSAGEIVRLKAKAYKADGDYEKAMGTILSLKELTRDDMMFAADLLEPSKDNRKSLSLCRKALEKGKAPSKAYVKLADAYYRTGREKDALRFYKMAVDDSPGDDAEWVDYMISKISQSTNEPKGSGIFTRSAEAGAKENDILKRMERIF